MADDIDTDRRYQVVIAASSQLAGVMRCSGTILPVIMRCPAHCTPPGAIGVADFVERMRGCRHVAAIAAETVLGVDIGSSATLRSWLSPPRWSRRTKPTGPWNAAAGQDGGRWKIVAQAWTGSAANFARRSSPSGAISR
jgi:hypothetical protein